MADKDKISEAKYSLEELVKAEKYRDKQDLLVALLEAGKQYAQKEVDTILDKYLKREVI